MRSRKERNYRLWYSAHQQSYLNTKASSSLQSILLAPTTDTSANQLGMAPQAIHKHFRLSESSRTTIKSRQAEPRSNQALYTNQMKGPKLTAARQSPVDALSILSNQGQPREIFLMPPPLVFFSSKSSLLFVA